MAEGGPWASALDSRGALRVEEGIGRYWKAMNALVSAGSVRALLPEFEVQMNLKCSSRT